MHTCPVAQWTSNGEVDELFDLIALAQAQRLDVAATAGIASYSPMVALSRVKNPRDPTYSSDSTGAQAML